jgi:pyridoxal phosphate enzyme (YggS family)
LINPDEVAERVTRIRGEIAQRGQHAVSLVAVTKSFGLDAIHAAVHARCDAIGENYAQELLDKVALQLPDIDVHFIGGIQSNKVKALAPHVALWQSVDKESVVKELAKRAPGAQVLLQVNTTGEGTKGGVAPSELELLLGQASDLGLGVRGLMTIGPTQGSDAEKRQAFVLLRSLADKYGLAECSMGMSDDYGIAVECGSTMIRIGSRLFGERRQSP